MEGRRQPLGQRGRHRRFFGLPGGTGRGRLPQGGQHLARCGVAARDHAGPGLDLAGMVQREAGDGEQHHPDQADRGTDPVPLVKVLEPEGAALLARGRLVVCHAGEKWEVRRCAAACQSAATGG
ncbi:hypothetical protein D3C87_1712330 [compost metagenome]